MNVKPKEPQTSILIRMTPDDKEYIKKKARKLNVSVNEYMIRASLDGNDKLVLHPEFMKILGKISEYANECNDERIGKEIEKLWTILS